MRKYVRRVPSAGNTVKREGAKRHVQCRLDARIPREADAIAIYDHFLNQGWQQRDVLVEALLRLGGADSVPYSGAELLTRSAIINLTELFQIARDLTGLIIKHKSGEINDADYMQELQVLERRFQDNAGDMFANFESFD